MKREVGAFSSEDKADTAPATVNKFRLNVTPLYFYGKVFNW
jgi:hypothetical protein